MTKEEFYKNVQTACKAMNGAKDAMVKTKLALVEKQCFTWDNMPAPILAADVVINDVAQSFRSIFDVALHLNDGSEINLSGQDIKDSSFMIRSCLITVFWVLYCVENRIKDKIDAACLLIAETAIAEIKSCFYAEEEIDENGDDAEN